MRDSRREPASDRDPSRIATLLTLAVLLFRLLLVPANAVQSAPVVVPERFKAVEPFVRLMEEKGIAVRAVDASDLDGLFTSIRGTAYLDTDKGQLDVAVFPEAADAERLTITYRRSAKGTKHMYVVAGWSKNQRPRETERDEPLYITLHRQWFIATPDAALDLLVKRALGQASAVSAPR